MKKRTLVLGIILVLALCVRLAAKDALILYGGAREKSESYISAKFLENLLCHFSSIRRTIVSPASDFEKETILDKDFVFLVQEEDKSRPSQSLLKSLLLFRGQIVWIDMHIEQFLALAQDTWSLSWKDFVSRTGMTVRYKDTDFTKEDPGLNVVKIHDPKNVMVYSTVRDQEGTEYPYVLRSKNLWYFADSPFSYAMEGGRFLVLEDLLHDILNEDHPSRHEALVRIEDVNAEDDPKSLRKIADYLARKHIPFQVSLVPIFKNPESQYELTLSERPGLISALQYMVRKGGTIILHGATHQHRGVSADDYEFWDDIAGVPIAHESPDWIDQRIKQAVDECFADGLYPLAWETPHYSASENTYRTIAKYFDTFYDRIMAAEISGTQQIFPYPAKLESLGAAVVPENLGYVDYKKPRPQEIVSAARKTLVVRDGMASFFFHPFVPLKHLKSIIKGMKKQGWTFVSIRDFPCNFRTESRWVTSQGGEGHIFLDNQYFREIEIDRKGKLIKENVSPARSKGTLSKTIEMAPGSLYVLEALDFLPQKPEKVGLSYRLAQAFRLFKKDEGKRILNIPKVLVLTSGTSSEAENLDQRSFESVFRVFGFNSELMDSGRLKTSALNKFNLLAVPYAAGKGLGDIEINTVLGFVEKGGSLIIEGKTPLSQKMGFLFESREARIAEVKELSMPAENVRWNPPATFYPFTTSEAIILSKDLHSDRPLAVVKQIGKGKVLFLGALLDPWTPFGLSRFPYLPYYLKNFLGVPFLIRNDNLEYYFDPGLRQNTSWEKLVVRWKESGTKIVYLATWHFYKDYRFDYRYFLDLCHNHGIAVYAWFEFPQITPLLWNEHPEWREKTASGRDARPHWRELMNLANPQARQAAGEFMEKILTEFDWDGVNLAELNFDTNKGAQDPANFTPMNMDVRKAFQESRGFDPLELFRPASARYWTKNPAAFKTFLDFRASLVKDLHAFFLNGIETIKKKKGVDWEVIVTAMDSLLHPEIIEECGINTSDIISLMDSFPFTLQVEDPARSWMKAPTRYRDYYETYRNYVKDSRRLMFDINVIARRDVRATNLPSLTPCGVELATTLYYAFTPSGRAGIYSEYTANPFDLDILPFVARVGIEVKEEKDRLTITASRPFTLLTVNSSDLPTLDGQPWPFYSSTEVSIPAGRHALSFKKARLLDFRLLSHRMSFDAEVGSFVREGNIYKLHYQSPIPTSLTFSRPLEAVRVDAKKIPLSADKSGVILPRGEHDLEIYAESPPAYTIDVVGYLSSSVFLIIGVLSVGLLLGLYIYSRMKRS